MVNESEIKQCDDNKRWQMLSDEICERARLSRDARFDGQFFTAVLTTGIFCRPICPARAAKSENVKYYRSAELALQRGFRPCKRCLSEHAPVIRLPDKIEKITQAYYANEHNLSRCAQQLKLSSRQIHRLFIQYYGLAPSVFFQQQRLLLAHKLLTTTALNITDVAFAAGFNSIRRFNEVIANTYQQTPRALRGKKDKTNSASVTVLLPYQGDFDWLLMLSFFRDRQISNIEQVGDDFYFKSIAIDDCQGWIHIHHHIKKRALNLTVQLSDYKYLSQVILRVRRMFDLDADMKIIHQQLQQHPLLKKVIEQYPGLRLPGCWDIFEFSIRAILGQQISVKAATTLAGRIAEKYGDDIKPLSLPNMSKVQKYFPNSEKLQDVDFEDIGLTRSRINTLQTWLAFYQENPDIFQCGLSIEQLAEILLPLKGIGPWTLNYIAMRGLSDPDAFPSADLGIIKALTEQGVKPNNKTILQIAEQWRPWRAYAVIYLWHSLH